MKRELNEQFRHTHPEIPPEITLSKIRSIKSHLLEIGKMVDLEVSSVAHAFAYFEKLVIKVSLGLFLYRFFFPFSLRIVNLKFSLPFFFSFINRMLLQKRTEN